MPCPTSGRADWEPVKLRERRLLDPSGHPPRAIRSTRLVDLVNTLDPKLVAAALGLDPQAPLIYLADSTSQLINSVAADTMVT